MRAKGGVALRRTPAQGEKAQYVRRIASLEKYIVLPARIAVIVASAAFLWPVIVAKVGGRELSSLFKWAIIIYALLSLLYWVYIFRFAAAHESITLTKSVVFASAMTDNVFLGVILYGAMMEPLGGLWLAALPQASLFWVYCGLLVRNTFLFAAAAQQMLVNCLYILGYVSAIIVNIWTLHPTGLSDLAQRELVFRVIVLFIVSICSSALYALRERRLREVDEARERTIRSLRLDIAGMLATQVAHELKNPLSIMTNAAFLLRSSKTDLDAKLRQQIEIIEDEIRRADQIITDLLDYAKLAEGRIESVLVNDTIDECLAALKNELESGGVQVERNYSLDLPFLFIDAGQLRQVLSNILLNACDAIEDGGKITVGTSYSTDGFIEVSISDTGRGMSPDVLSNIFKPFFTTKKRGTGMGLSIAENVVRAYRGQVTVQSELRKGTTFHLRFPTRMALGTQEEPFRLPAPRHRVKSAIRSAQA